MAGMNFRNVYGFDPEAYDSQGAGGLLGMLQTMMQQNQDQPSADFGSTPNRANGYGNPRGLLGRLLAMMEPGRLRRVAIPRPREAMDSHRLFGRRRMVNRVHGLTSPFGRWVLIHRTTPKPTAGRTARGRSRTFISKLRKTTKRHHPFARTQTSGNFRGSPLLGHKPRAFR